MSNALKYFIVLVVMLGCTSTGICQSTETVNIGRGDVKVYVPSSYDKSKPLPLIVALHGFSANSSIIERYWRLQDLVDAKQFLLCLPNGTKNSKGQRFWNATDMCCDTEDSGTDDSGYLLALVEHIESTYVVDPLSIHFAGHSNGGFMSYRMACDHAEKIASIVSLAGATYIDNSEHVPSEPVHVLQIHGTLDTVIKYDGGCWKGDCYPSALKSVEVWAKFNNCKMPSIEVGTLDLDAFIPDSETTIVRYEPNGEYGCVSELWAIQDASHAPSFNQSFPARIIDWMLLHRKQVMEDVDSSASTD